MRVIELGLNYKLLKTEGLYNRIVYEYRDMDLSSSGDKRLNKLKTEYKALLDNLKTQGIGGVLINGVFRNIQE